MSRASIAVLVRDNKKNNVWPDKAKGSVAL